MKETKFDCRRVTSFGSESLVICWSLGLQTAIKLPIIFRSRSVIRLTRQARQNLPATCFPAVLMVVRLLQVLLRQEHHDQGPWKEVRVQI